MLRISTWKPAEIVPPAAERIGEGGRQGSGSALCTPYLHEGVPMKLLSVLCAASIAALPLAACSSTPTPKSSEKQADVKSDAQSALSKAKTQDPTLGEVLDNSVAYAVFPKVGKGGVGVGGAYGRGVFYENGKMVGYCDLTQASVGAQLGGQTYTEIICFENKAAVDRFKAGNLTLDAQASAVALKSGTGRNARFEDGVAVMTT